MFITRADGDLVVTRVEVEFGEVFGFPEAIMEIIDAGDREVVFNGDIIQPTIVDTHSHRAIFLFDKEDSCTKRAT